MTTTIYTYGYSGRAPQELGQLATVLDATVFDIRFSPRSRNAAWSGKRLRQRLGDRYQHVKAFGNVNYKGGHIELVNYNMGLAQILKSAHPVILVCVCKDPSICHRTYIARKLEADGFSEIEELTPKRIQEVLKCSTPQQPPLFTSI